MVIANKAATRVKSVNPAFWKDLFISIFKILLLRRDLSNSNSARRRAAVHVRKCIIAQDCEAVRARGHATGGSVPRA